MRDFTIEKYRELCQALRDADYALVNVYQYLTNHSDRKVAVIRHDVDRKPENARAVARLEHSLGICSTYYFRYPATFVPEIIKEICDLGHEVGYHYEALAKTKGDYEKAIALFTRELAEFREIYDVRTICMHGSPLSRYDNRDLWKSYDLREFELVGEAYLSMYDKGLVYFTDTGRSWGGKHSIRDMMPGVDGAVSVETTDDLVRWIESGEAEGFYLTMHPERWAVSRMEWAIAYVRDVVINAGKTIFVAIR